MYFGKLVLEFDEQEFSLRGVKSKKISNTTTRIAKTPVNISELMINKPCVHSFIHSFIQTAGRIFTLRCDVQVLNHCATKMRLAVDQVCKKYYEANSYTLFFSRPRSEGWPHHERTFSIYLCTLVILIDSSTNSPVHVLMLSIKAVCGLLRLRAPDIVPWYFAEIFGTRKLDSIGHHTVLFV